MLLKVVMETFLNNDFQSVANFIAMRGTYTTRRGSVTKKLGKIKRKHKRSHVIF